MPGADIETDRNEFIKSLSSLVLRAENRESSEFFTSTLLPLISFDTLLSENNQIFFGRNGTGKTHLLRAFQAHCTKNYEKQRALCAYVDLRSMDLGIIGANLPVSELISKFYFRLLKTIVDHVSKFSSSQQSLGLFERLFKGDAARRKARIAECLEELDELLSENNFEQRMTKVIGKIEAEESGKSKLKAGIGLGFEVSETSAKASARANLGTSAEASRLRKQTVEVVYAGLSVIDYSAICTRVEEIIDLSGARCLIVLLDELSSVDVAMQPVLLEMMKKTLSPSNRVFLKMATLEYFTRTSSIVEPPQRIGMQLGIELDVVADLDSIMNCDADISAVSSLLTEILYLHMMAEQDEIGQMTRDAFLDYLCGSIFSTKESYLEAVRASEGNPRDFLSIVSSCASGIGVKSDKTVGQREVIYSATRQFQLNKAPEIENKRASSQLFADLFSAVVKNKSKLFLVSTKLSRIDERLKELWHYRFIHIVRQEEPFIDEEDEVATYTIYSMDYGKLLSLKARRKGEKVVDAMLSLIDQLGKSIQVPLIDRDLGEVCRYIIDETGYAEKLQEVIGRSVVSWQGMEKSEIDVDEMLINSIFDDVVQKNLPRKLHRAEA